MPHKHKLNASQFSRSKIVFLLVLLPCLFLFPRIVSLLDTKWFTPGELPNGPFYVARATISTEQPFELVLFSETLRSASFFTCPRRDLTVHIGEFEIIECHVLEQTDSAVVIETVKSDDDYTITSRYRIEGRRISPLMRRIFGPGHGMTGFALAILFCSLLFYVLRWATKSDANNITA